ncbi:lipoprotein LpqH [Mycolicibacterium celeriflavum]|uniref:lipoprotein LpqH n=1 Tax=Mycolicibacterium celeriflavum TaxID=1249101 RepID=UPI0009EEDEE1|nr:lipoprotein LpqH [Mycolicibacterium celeriflavum]
MTGGHCGYHLGPTPESPIMVEDLSVMRTAAALLLTAGLSGCSSPPPASPDTMGGTATVSINSQPAGERSYVSCHKVKWLLTIESGDEDKGFTAIVDTDDGPDAAVVKIRDLGGFTGSAWTGGVGKLRATRDNGRITINGTGYGFFAEDPHRTATAAFSITAAC